MESHRPFSRVRALKLRRDKLRTRLHSAACESARQSATVRSMIQYAIHDSHYAHKDILHTLFIAKFSQGTSMQS